jgi:hypothetical protein
MISFTLLLMKVNFTLALICFGHCLVVLIVGMSCYWHWSVARIGYGTGSVSDYTDRIALCTGLISHRLAFSFTHLSFLDHRSIPVTPRVGFQGLSAPYL